jgi:serine beta-lactamase-like protein LACTB, mitochondrial
MLGWLSLRPAALAALFAIAAHAAVFAQTPASPAPRDDSRTHAHAVAADILARGTPGLAVAIARDGRLVYSECLGEADLEQHVLVRPTTKFRIGSISKPLTAVGLMRLVEQGKIDLDAPVQQYVPSFPDKGGKISPRMLAGHLAGIRHYQGDEFLISRHYDSVVEGLQIFAADPLVAPPGTKYSYSTYGYNLLSAVIESAAGEPFVDYMEREVIARMGLAHTTADRNRAIVEDRSRFYTREEGKPLENSAYVDNSYKWAGGGFLSTAEDLVRFGNQLLQPGILRADSLRLLFTAQTTAAGEKTGYGIGWGIRTSRSGKGIYEHSGGSVGGRSRLIIYPDLHLVVALVTNLGEARFTIEDVESIGEPFADSRRDPASRPH